MKNIVRIAFLLLGCFACNNGYAQYFSNLYTNGEPVMLFGSIKAMGGNFYVTGITAIKDKAVFAKIDNTGTPAFFKTYLDSSDCSNYYYDIFLNSLKRTSDGNFIATGNVSDSVQRAFLMKVDSNGNLLLWHEYTEAGNLIFQGDDVVEVPDSGYLIAVNICRSNYVSSVMIIRSDTLGNATSTSNYYKGQRATPEIIRPTLNGHYMVGAFSGDPSDNTPYWAQTWLLEIDGEGSMVREWLDTDRTNLWPNGMEQTADGGWIIVRQHLDYDVNDFQQFNASVLKIDKNFNKEWDIHLGDSSDATGFYDIKILPDGNYIACGTTPTWGYDSAYYWGWLNKIDTGGHVLWDTKYAAVQRFGTHSLLNSLELLPNGDLLAAGQLDFTFNIGEAVGQQGWIIRTDSNGCLLDSCWLTGVEEISKPEVSVKVFPNPTSSYVVFETNATDMETAITVYDICGRVVARPVIKNGTQIQVDTRPWQDGFYIWRAVQQGVDAGEGKLEIMR